MPLFDLKTTPKTKKKDNEIETLIDEYKQKSLTICEICGKTGFLRKDLSWLQTLCDDHYKEIKK